MFQDIPEMVTSLMVTSLMVIPFMVAPFMASGCRFQVSLTCEHLKHGQLQTRNEPETMSELWVNFVRELCERTLRELWETFERTTSFDATLKAIRNQQVAMFGDLIQGQNNFFLLSHCEQKIATSLESFRILKHTIVLAVQRFRFSQGISLSCVIIPFTHVQTSQGIPLKLVSHGIFWRDQQDLDLDINIHTNIFILFR